MATATRWMHRLLRAAASAGIACAALCATAQAQNPPPYRAGLTELPGSATAGPILVFHPTDSDPVELRRGVFTVRVAHPAGVVRGNGRLIVISHGSGAHPMVQSDIAIHLARAGYLVAIPEHAGDNWHDSSQIGPPSWQRRPQEVSRAIDVLAGDARFAPLFDAQRVGVFGMSAGGHTALTLAGGRWSRARLLAHCEDHLADDFIACAGPTVALEGDALDGLKLRLARMVIRWNLGGDTPSQGHTDPRIRAAVAGVPFAADFDPASLHAPAIPLGIVQAEQDRWLVPRFHSMAVAERCTTCTLLASLPQAGHGALLAPLPPTGNRLLDRLIADPPGFDRSSLPALYQRIEAYFRQHLLP